MQIKIVHFSNGSGGGVLSVIRNLLIFKQNDQIENHVIYCINIDKQENCQVPFLPGAASTKIFYYSSQWNFFYTCKQLLELLPSRNSVLIAHDWLELGMVSHLGLSNPVVFFLHGDYQYYYKLAKQHCDVIDSFVCVAASISERLKEQLSGRVKDIYYLRFPVPDFSPNTDIKRKNRVIFLGRCEEQKGYFLLPLISKKIQQKGVDIEWHIVGEGSDVQEKQVIFNSGEKIIFHGLVPTAKVNELLAESKVLILPSRAEGMPLAVIEAMKAGVVPLVNQIPGGLNELVLNGVTGFMVPNDDLEQYVQCLNYILQDSQSFLQLSANAEKHAKALFNAEKNTFVMENLFIRTSKNLNYKTKKKIYGSRLDQPWVPNFFTFLVRRLLKLM